MNDSISHFSLRNLSNAILYSQIFGPLPRVKKYSREEFKKYGGIFSNSRLYKRR